MVMKVINFKTIFPKVWKGFIIDYGYGLDAFHARTFSSDEFHTYMKQKYNVTVRAITGSAAGTAEIDEENLIMLSLQANK
jgi:hypothetical protein